MDYNQTIINMDKIQNFINETGYSKDVVLDFLKKKKSIDSLYCKCGKPKRLVTSKQAKLGVKFDGYCGAKECHPGFGKKRPEHSVYMKKLAMSGENESFSETLMKPGQLHNKEVNTIAFKRKKLANKGYDVSLLKDEDIISLEKKYEHDKQFTNESLARKISKFISKHKLNDFFVNTSYDELVLMPNEELLKLKKEVYSYHHHIYCSDSCVAGRFIREEKFNLKNNIRQLTYVKTRSSYESNYIDFFEKNNIRWDYEPFRIMIYNEYYVSYTPDFVIEYDNKKYLIEVKGYLLENNKDTYLKYKINPAYEFAENSSEYDGFIFTYESKPKSMEKMLTYTLKEKF